MSRGPQASATEETRRHLFDTAIGLIENDSCEELTINRLSKAACVSRPTFYRHFKNMDDFIDELMLEYSAIEQCLDIINHVDEVPLEEATDWIASFYEQNAHAVKVLCTCDKRFDYIDLQASIFKPMFQQLISRALDTTPLQIDYLSEYVANAKASMIHMWVIKGQLISLGQINKLTENLLEKDLWTKVALQSPIYAGPKTKETAEKHQFHYPWEHHPKAEGKSFKKKISW